MINMGKIVIFLCLGEWIAGYPSGFLFCREGRGVGVQRQSNYSRTSVA